MFAVVPTFFSMAPAALSVAPVELLMKLVHGEQDFHFHRPIKPGDVLTCRAKPTGYAALSNGSTVVVYAETRDRERRTGQRAVDDRLLPRASTPAQNSASRRPATRFDDVTSHGSPSREVTQHIDEDQTFRYSPASGDPMPIHLDEEIAQMSGLPGIINHGLCTMAFTSWAALHRAGRRRRRAAAPSRGAVREARTARPGHRPPASGSSTVRHDGTTSYAFETTVGDDLVIRDGLAVIADD